MTNDERIIQLLKELIEVNKELKEEIIDLKNLFIKYDMEEMIHDENLREG